MPAARLAKPFECVFFWQVTFVAIVVRVMPLISRRPSSVPSRGASSRHSGLGALLILGLGLVPAAHALPGPITEPAFGPTSKTAGYSSPRAATNEPLHVEKKPVTNEPLRVGNKPATGTRISPLATRNHTLAPTSELVDYSSLPALRLWGRRMSVEAPVYSLAPHDMGPVHAAGRKSGLAEYLHEHKSPAALSSGRYVITSARSGLALVANDAEHTASLGRNNASNAFQWDLEPAGTADLAIVPGQPALPYTTFNVRNTKTGRLLTLGWASDFGASHISASGTSSYRRAAQFVFAEHADGSHELISLDSRHGRCSGERGHVHRKLMSYALGRLGGAVCHWGSKYGWKLERVHTVTAGTARGAAASTDPHVAVRGARARSYATSLRCSHDLHACRRRELLTSVGFRSRLWADALLPTTGCPRLYVWTLTLQMCLHRLIDGCLN